MRGGYKRFFPRGLFQQPDPGLHHFAWAVVRHANGYRIFNMERMNYGVGNKE